MLILGRVLINVVFVMRLGFLVACSLPDNRSDLIVSAPNSRE